MAALIILAGGKSSRMGRNKALLPLGDQPLIEVLYRRLRPCFDEIVLSVNDRTGYPQLDATWVADLYPDAGALGGMHAALQAMHSAHAFIIGCDMPQPNRGLVRDLLALAPTADAIVPRIAGRPEPTHAVYANAVVPAIEKQLQAQRYKITSFFEDVRVRYVEEGELRRRDPELLSFTDLDTPAEYERYLGRPT